MNKTCELLKPFSKENPEPEPKELIFCCPECGSSKLTQGMTIRFFREVEGIYEDGTVEVGYAFEEDVQEAFYECTECLYPLQDASGNLVGTGHDLAKWFEENCQQDLPQNT